MKIGCPNAWKAPRECDECGQDFIPKWRMQEVCNDCFTDLSEPYIITTEIEDHGNEESTGADTCPGTLKEEAAERLRENEPDDAITRRNRQWENHK